MVFIGEHFLKALDFTHLKVSKLWIFFSGDSIVLQSFLPCFDHIFNAGFSTEVWQSVIEKLAKKGLWHVSTEGGSHTRKTHSFKIISSHDTKGINVLLLYLDTRIAS